MDTTEKSNLYETLINRFTVDLGVIFHLLYCYMNSN